MSDDWQPGDLAICVNVGNVDCPGTDAYHVPNADLVAHRYYRVVGVGSNCHPSGCRCAKLHFSDTSAVAQRFRKVRAHEADEEDRITIELLTRAPVKEPAA